MTSCCRRTSASRQSCYPGPNPTKPTPGTRRCPAPRGRVTSPHEIARQVERRALAGTQVARDDPADRVEDRGHRVDARRVLTERLRQAARSRASRSMRGCARRIGAREPVRLRVEAREQAGAVDEERRAERVRVRVREQVVAQHELRRARHEHRRCVAARVQRPVCSTVSFRRRARAAVVPVVRKMPCWKLPCTRLYSTVTIVVLSERTSPQKPERGGCRRSRRRRPSP